MMRSRYDSTALPGMDPDVIDFTSFFEKQDPYNLRILTALRMNATFPIVLPNVWLPSDPVIDVMDAGLRDNYGQETGLRFLEFFDDWLKHNTLFLRIHNSEIAGIMEGRQKVKVYSWAVPKDPAVAATVRVRRILLCTLYTR